MSAAVVEELPRGVYTAPYRVKGVRVVFCVDRFGDARKHLKVRSPEQEARARQALWELLDMIDPAPRPRLVAPDPAGPGWPYDIRQTPPPAVTLLRLPPERSPLTVY